MNIQSDTMGSIIKHIADKHGGKYLPEGKGLDASGKMISRPEIVILDFQEARIEISLRDGTGHFSNANPYRFRLLVDAPKEKLLHIYPKTSIQKLFSRKRSKANSITWNQFQSKYKIRASKELIQTIQTQQNLLEKLNRVELFITYPEKTGVLVLCPSKGIYNLQEAEGCIQTLKLLKPLIS